MDMETIYRLYFRDVYLFLQGLTRSETLAEELTQETFFKALDGLKGFDGKRDVRAWLFTVARNCYYDHCRKARHAAPLEDAETKGRRHAGHRPAAGGQGCRLYGAPVPAQAGGAVQGSVQPAGVRRAVL